MYNYAITLPFTITSNGIGKTSDISKIYKDRVYGVVLTSLNERVMSPTFGTKVKAALFSNIDDALNSIEQSVQIGFAKWLKGLTLNSVSGSIDAAEGNLNIEILYSIPGTIDEQSVTLKTAILSRSGEILLEVRNGQY
jgi:phage baseplate assembly protein W